MHALAPLQPARLRRAVRAAGAAVAPQSRAGQRHARRRSRRSAARSTVCRWRSSSPRRGCGRCRCREIARRLDDRFALLRDPSSRRPERRRALAGAIAWSYDLLFPDDQRGAVGAVLLRRQGPARRRPSTCSAALDVPAGRSSTRRPARRSLAGRSSRCGADGAVRYRLLDSIRALRRRPSARVADCGDGRVAAHADVVRRGCRPGARRTSAARGSPTAWRSPAPSGPTSTPRWPGPPRTIRRSGVRIATGFGWTWVVLGDGTAGAARVRDAADRRRAACRDRVAGAAARRLAGGVGRRTWCSPRPISTGRATGRRARPTTCCIADVDRHRAFLPSSRAGPTRLADARRPASHLPSARLALARRRAACCSARSAR